MKRIYLLLLLTFLIPITNVSGFYCKFSEISRYKGLASNISTTYDYVETDNSLTFNITLVNLNKELYIVDTTTNKVYRYQNSELTISGYNPGTTVKYAVYTTNENCSDTLLYTIRVVLPSYNQYYSDPICIGLSDYIYCQKWYDNKMDYKTFVDKVTAYKNSLVDDPIVEQPTIDDYDIWDAILDVVIEYYYVILIAIIIICGTIIYINEKKSDIYW